jgi:proteasome accessory factor B
MISKLERLLNLTAALLATARPLTAEQLRTRLDGYPDADASFRRAFERDKDDLRQMGIPITIAEVPGSDPPIVGYVIDRAEYSGNDPELAPDELAALHVAANLVRLGDRTDGAFHTDGALWKLGGVVDTAGEVRDATPLVDLPADENLAPLFRAATELRVAQFTYRELTREVEPLRLSFNRGHWYLAAFDRTRGDERLYRVDRIDGSVSVGPPRAFVRRAALRADPHVRSWELGDGDPVHASLLVDGDQAAFATHQLGVESIIERRDNGDVVFMLTVRNVGAFRSFVLTYLDHAEVLAPPAMRDVVTHWLRDIVASAS